MWCWHFHPVYFYLDYLTLKSLDRQTDGLDGLILRYGTLKIVIKFSEEYTFCRTRGSSASSRAPGRCARARGAAARTAPRTSCRSCRRRSAPTACGGGCGAGTCCALPESIIIKSSRQTIQGHDLSTILYWHTHRKTTYLATQKKLLLEIIIMLEKKFHERNIKRFYVFPPNNKAYENEVADDKS